MLARKPSLSLPKPPRKPVKPRSTVNLDDELRKLLRTTTNPTTKCLVGKLLDRRSDHTFLSDAVLRGFIDAPISKVRIHGFLTGLQDMRHVLQGRLERFVAVPTRAPLSEAQKYNLFGHPGLSFCLSFRCGAYHARIMLKGCAVTLRSAYKRPPARRNPGRYFLRDIWERDRTGAEFDYPCSLQGAWGEARAVPALPGLLVAALGRPRSQHRSMFMGSFLSPRGAAFQSEEVAILQKALDAVWATIVAHRLSQGNDRELKAIVSEKLCALAATGVMDV